MAATSRTIIERILTRLRTINGSGGGYVHDFSSDTTGIVQFGEPQLPDAPPRVYVTGSNVQSTDGHDLGSYSRILQVQIVGYAGPAGDEAEARGLSAHDLLDDIAQALEADRTLNGNVINMRVSGDVDAVSINACGLGVVNVDVEVEYIAASGVGT